MKQKFHKGDHVQVAKDLGSWMSHFTNDCEAIVQHSYRDEYGGGESTNPPIDQYSIYIKGQGSVAWYYESQLTLIDGNRIDLLDQWEKEAKQEADTKSDMDWIFAHGQEVLDHTHGATVKALAACFGLNNLWGSRGEGVTYFSNARMTMNLAKSFLLDGNKDGWMEFCQSNKEQTP